MMSTNFLYYRCPCPSADCNGAICRYQDIVAAPVPSQYSSPSCSLFTPERKLLTYPTTTKDIASPSGKYESMSTPVTIARDNFRWTPYQSQSRVAQESSSPPKTTTERRKLVLFSKSYQLGIEGKKCSSMSSGALSLKISEKEKKRRYFLS